MNVLARLGNNKARAAAAAVPTILNLASIMSFFVEAGLGSSARPPILPNYDKLLTKNPPEIFIALNVGPVLVCIRRSAVFCQSLTMEIPDAILAVSLALLYFYLLTIWQKLARSLAGRSGTLPAVLETRWGPPSLALGCEALICVAIWVVVFRPS